MMLEKGVSPFGWTCGEKACHPEPMRCAQGKLRAGSGSTDTQILRYAQDDSQDTAHVRSREVFSPNAWPSSASHCQEMVQRSLASEQIL